MRVLPITDQEFCIMPETETEAYYINKFLLGWQNGSAKIKLTSGLMGNNPQNVLELTSPQKMVPLTFIQPM
jgi:hypothetical protein